MKRPLGLNEFLNKKFTALGVDNELLDFFGDPEANTSIILVGKSGNGKTQSTVNLICKLAPYINGKIFYNSYEQGQSLTLQEAFRREDTTPLTGKLQVAHKEPWAVMIKRLDRRKSPALVVIDSIQYVRMTYQMWQELRTRYPKKMFILISHAKGDDPADSNADKIKYDVDIKILVKGFVMYPDSRYGGNQPIVVYEAGYRRWLARNNKSNLLDNNKKETSDTDTAPAATE